MDLDFSGLFWKEETLSYNQRNYGMIIEENNLHFVAKTLDGTLTETTLLPQWEQIRYFYREKIAPSVGANSLL